MPEFLLELLSEDIPARMQVQAAEDLKRLVTESLTQAGLTFDSAHAHSTPRRLALVIDGLPRISPDRTEERKGPKVGAPDGAIQGFLKGARLNSIDQAEIRDTDKGQVYFAVSKVAGKPAGEILAASVLNAVNTLPWPKSMRWGSDPRRWVRPLHQVLAVFDEQTLTVGGDLPAPPVAGSTKGHRFLAPKSFEVKNFKDYEEKLLQHNVVLDREKRKWRILGDIKRKAEERQMVLAHDEPLLEEVAGLVEWPVVLVADIDHDYMDLPPEVRRTTMRANQKYFTLEHGDGRPAPHFVLVANMETEDGGAAVIAGNERVLRARLSDARFFYDQDRKTTLHDQRPKLAKIAFHAKLGTVADRVDRLERLATILSQYVPRAETSMAVEAARLCKCDLVTGMVGEFPELQGIMGRYYALDQDAPSHVADAIRDHYKPLGPGDACPTAPVSVVLALAEKLDTLVGFFAIDEKPTGSKDPFALRRAALGVIRLIVENGLRIPLGQVIDEALGLFRDQGVFNDKTPVPNMEEALNRIFNANFAIQLVAFFADRLKVALKERGVRHDLIDAVFAVGDTLPFVNFDEQKAGPILATNEDDLVRLLARVEALQGFLATDDGANLLAAYRRAANILKIEEKRDGVSYDGAASVVLMSEAEERALNDALTEAGSAVDPLIAAEDFQGAMARYAALRPVVDAFFDRVTVNAPESNVRTNRLLLLSRIRGTLNKIADFSRIA